MAVFRSFLWLRLHRVCVPLLLYPFVCQILKLLPYLGHCKQCCSEPWHPCIFLNNGFLCTLAWKVPWTEEPGGLQSMGSLSRTRLSNFTFTFHFHALEKEMATRFSVLAWRIPRMGEPGGLPSRGSHRAGHDWSDSAAAAAGYMSLSGIAGSYGSSVYRFLRNLNILLHHGCIHLQSHQ